jgi:AcrR family transcriptional regulator
VTASAPAPAPAAPARGRHRSTEADTSILCAALALLRDRGYGGLTMAAVIEESGVSSATLYRRWPTKHELVAAAIDSLAPEPIAIDTGTLKGDLSTFLRHLAQAYTAREVFVESLTAGGVRDPDLASAVRDKVIVPRLGVLELVLARAVERGELTVAPSSEEALSLLAGPLYYRISVLGEALTPKFVATVTAHALRGLGVGNA